MEEKGDLFRRLVFLSLFLAIVSGFGLNYFQRGSALKFVSPVVFGSEVKKNQADSSPFAFLLARTGKSTGERINDLLGNVLGFSVQPPVELLGKEAVGAKSPTVSGSTSSDTSSSGVASSGSSSNTSSSTSNSSDSSSTSGSNSSSSLSSGTDDLNSFQKAVDDVSDLVISYLRTGSYAALYNLMSQDFKNTFSQDDFVGSFAGSVAVVSGSTSSTPKVYGTNNDWAEEQVLLILADGNSQKYLNIYHSENGSWTLYGTEDQ